MNTAALVYSALVIAVISLIMGIAAIVLSKGQRSWRKIFRKESEPENLEEIIEAVASKIKKLEDGHEATEQTLKQLSGTLATSLQHVGLIRFDSGSDDGGNLSFSLALLSAQQNGLIITSLHGRQHNRIYAKAITIGASEQTLSEEEKEALIQALTNK